MKEPASQRERMLAGLPYDASDPELAAGRRRARDLLANFNAGSTRPREEQVAWLRQLLGSAGANPWIEAPFHCDYGSNIRVGDDVYFNFNCIVLDPGRVEIGDRCLFGPHVQIYTATHPLGAMERRSGLEGAKPVTIGNDVWVGGGAILLPGVHIGDGAVIGAGSVVTRDVPAGMLAAGNPCRVIRPASDRALNA
jgi:maltose O-acetyltransferase